MLEQLFALWEVGHNKWDTIIIWGAFIVKELSAGEFVGFVDTSVNQPERVATG